MQTQKKHTILNIIIVIAVIMLILIIGSIAYEYVINENSENQVGTNNEIVNSEEENEDTEKEPEEPTENNDNANDYVGQEEQEAESNNTNEETDDEKAIALAKKEWGNDTSVQFSIEEKKANKYYIAVKSNATVIAWYEVNIETWEISEFY